MNIDEYRVLKEQQETQQNSQKESTEEVEKPEVIEQVVEEKTSETPVVEENKTEQKEVPKIEEIEIDGIGKVSINELKDGYFRQSDYTKKTQELAREKKENADAIALFNYLKENPNVAQVVSEKVKLPETVDPTTAKVIELENRLYDMMLDNELRDLKSKYDDFDAMKVMKIAHDKQITNLEDAYMLSKKRVEPVDMTEIESKLRAKIMREMEEEKNSTQTLISSSKTTPIKMEEKHISKQEQYVAKNMKMTDEDFIFWRDKKGKGK